MMIEVIMSIINLLKKCIPFPLKEAIISSIIKNPTVIQRILDNMDRENDKFKDITAAECLKKLILDFEFDSVLDIGSGEGLHSKIFLDSGKKVTSLDYGESVYFKRCNETHSTVICDYYDYSPHAKFNCIWASHVLEHQPNPNIFLKKIYNDLDETGILAITVPPLKNQIVGGHVNLYNAGILLYQLILAGFDCSEASIATYGYNISIIVRKGNPVSLSNITFDSGDIYTLKRYFPTHIRTLIGDNDFFDGRIDKINW